jgi:hypothetical protein
LIERVDEDARLPAFFQLGSHIHLALQLHALVKLFGIGGRAREPAVLSTFPLRCVYCGETVSFS